MAVPNSGIDPGDPVFGPKVQRRKIILCFDGTGNKFQGNEGDSNSGCIATSSTEFELKKDSFEDILDA